MTKRKVGRRLADFYQTPYSMTRQLLEEEYFNGMILEPAAGAGAIVRILNDFGFSVYSTDIDHGDDFMKHSRKDTYRNIITNPPFSQAKEFIMKSKAVALDKIALLLPLNYLHGQERYERKLFSELKTIYIFTRYPFLSKEIRGDGKYKTGMIAYAWYIWKKGHTKDPIIKWINNDPYVLKK